MEDRRSGLSVLWATDGAELQESVAQVLNSLLLPSAREINVLAVAPLGAVRVPVPRSAEQRRASLDEALAAASRAREALEASGVPGKAKARWGSAAKEILAEIAETGPDILVIGKPQHTLIREMFVRSTARQILEQAPCSVLVARGEHLEAESVLVALVRNRWFRQAEKVLARLEIAPSMKIRLLGFLEPPMDVPGMFVTYRRHVQDMQAIDRETKRGVLERSMVSYAAALREKGMQVETRLVEATVIEGLQDDFGQRPARLVIIGDSPSGLATRGGIKGVEDVAFGVPASVLVAR